MAPLSRRGFLVWAALLAPLARLRLLGQGAPAVSLEAFLRLSERLTGRTNLDAEIAATYRSALLAVPAHIPLLAQMVQGAGHPRTAEHVALECTILEWWHTGIYTVGGKPRLATHSGALMWSAMGMPAPGTCAGTFGAWSQPPVR